jgi:hypothetical protein
MGNNVTYRSSIESGYSFIELADMHLVLGKCIENATDAVRKYREHYHNQRIPDRRDFLSVARGLQEAGTFHGARWDVGLHLLHVRVWTENKILEVTEGQPASKHRFLPNFCTPYNIKTAVVPLPHSV